jgi:hypothetical protein
MPDDNDALRDRVERLEQEVAALRRGPGNRGVRKRSATEFLGLPLWEIATGPDPDANEIRGHAKAVIAIGDIATGFLAIGGCARGVIALGGLAVGVIAFGGAAIGALLAIGGGAVGGVAIGGGIALGGGAVGYYAFGGGAYGQFVYSAIRRDPQAVALAEAVADFLQIPMP